MRGEVLEKMVGTSLKNHWLSQGVGVNPGVPKEELTAFEWIQFQFACFPKTNLKNLLKPFTVTLVCLFDDGVRVKFSVIINKDHRTSMFPIIFK